KSAGSPNDTLLSQDLTSQVERALATLSAKEKEILRLRFGIGEGGEHTLEEVGKRFAATRERIRQIEAKALRKLRHPLRGRNLRAFIENYPHRSVARAARSGARSGSLDLPHYPRDESLPAIHERGRV